MQVDSALYGSTQKEGPLNRLTMKLGQVFLHTSVFAKQSAIAEHDGVTVPALRVLVQSSFSELILDDTLGGRGPRSSHKLTCDRNDDIATPFAQGRPSLPPRVMGTKHELRPIDLRARCWAQFSPLSLAVAGATRTQ